jgi:regulatory protein YycI of two-component signal transduction system YycFG
MDWSRAKTTLMIAFILLNLFLMVQLHDVRLQKSSIQTDRADKTQVDHLLAENQITLTPRSPVEFQSLAPYKATISAFAGQGWQKEERGGYRKTFSEPPPVQEIAERNRFLQGNVPYFGEYQLVESASTSSKHHVYMQKSKNGYLIYDGRIEVDCTDSAWMVRVIHYELKEASAGSDQPTDYYTALYRLITSGKVASKSTISSVQLVYRAKSIPNVSEDILLVPYWYFHVDANTFELNATYRGLSESVELVSKNL